MVAASTHVNAKVIALIFSGVATVFVALGNLIDNFMNTCSLATLRSVSLQTGSVKPNRRHAGSATLHAHIQRLHHIAETWRQTATLGIDESRKICLAQKTDNLRKIYDTLAEGNKTSCDLLSVALVFYIRVPVSQMDSNDSRSVFAANTQRIQAPGRHVTDISNESEILWIGSLHDEINQTGCCLGCLRVETDLKRRFTSQSFSDFIEVGKQILFLVRSH